MRVFNVTPATEVEYRGRMIPPNGGFVDVPDTIFIPERDRKLERDGMIAFHSLPAWFIQKREMTEAARQPTTAPVVVQETLVMEPEVLEPIVLEPSTVAAEAVAPKKRK